MAVEQPLWIWGERTIFLVCRPTVKAFPYRRKLLAADERSLPRVVEKTEKVNERDAEARLR